MSVHAVHAGAERSVCNIVISTESLGMFQYRYYNITHTSLRACRAVMYMSCVKCSCFELKLAKHLHSFFVFT